MTATLKALPATAWWSLLALLSLALAVFSYRYLPGVGLLAPGVMANLFARPWLDVHIAGAATALLVGWLQVSPPIRRRWPGLHRRTGRIYVVACLVGGVGGLVLAFGATAGPVATAGFGSLAVLWIAVNLLGWRAAMARRFEAHRRWMLRSWALTLAAVTLRLYMLALPALGIDGLEGYRAISFLCWIPNLLIAEAWLARR
jgi:hypothetical protein